MLLRQKSRPNRLPPQLHRHRKRRKSRPEQPNQNRLVGALSPPNLALPAATLNHSKKSHNQAPSLPELRPQPHSSKKRQTHRHEKDPLEKSDRRPVARHKKRPGNPTSCHPSYLVSETLPNRPPKPKTPSKRSLQKRKHHQRVPGAKKSPPNGTRKIDRANPAVVVATGTETEIVTNHVAIETKRTAREVDAIKETQSRTRNQRPIASQRRDPIAMTNRATAEKKDDQDVDDDGDHQVAIKTTANDKIRQHDTTKMALKTK